MRRLLFFWVGAVLYVSMFNTGRELGAVVFGIKFVRRGPFANIQFGLGLYKFTIGLHWPDHSPTPLQEARH